MNAHTAQKRAHLRLVCTLTVALVCAGTQAGAEIAADDFSSSIYDAGPPATVSGGTGSWVQDFWTYGSRDGATEATDVSGGSLDVSITAVRATSDVGTYSRSYDPGGATSVTVAFDISVTSLPTAGGTAVQDRIELWGAPALDTNGAGGNSSWILYGGADLQDLAAALTAEDTDKWIFRGNVYEASTVTVNTTDTFRFTIEDNLADGTFVATVENLTTSDSYTSSTINYRGSPFDLFTEAPTLSFGSRFSTSGDTVQFVIDNVRIVASVDPTLEITSYDRGTGDAVVSLTGKAGTAYQITATDDLGSPFATVLSLTNQGTGVVAGDGLSVTTTDEGDGTGLATVGIALGTGSKNFVRAEEAP